MQLFVKDNFGKKIVLDVTSPTRTQLAYKIGYEFYVGNYYYNVNQVFAESSSNDTAGGAAIGGLVGIIGGGIGVAVGGLLGGIIGKLKDIDERNDVTRFNKSLA